MKRSLGVRRCLRGPKERAAPQRGRGQDVAKAWRLPALLRAGGQGGGQGGAPGAGQKGEGLAGSDRKGVEALGTVVLRSGRAEAGAVRGGTGFRGTEPRRERRANPNLEA